MADSGQLICVPAGPADAIDSIRPYMKLIGRSVIDLSGQTHGKASLLKIIGNTFVLNMVETLAQGHTLAEKSGLGTTNLHAFVQAIFPGPFEAYSNRMLQGDYYRREEVGVLYCLNDAFSSCYIAAFRR